MDVLEEVNDATFSVDDMSKLRLMAFLVESGRIDQAQELSGMLELANAKSVAAALLDEAGADERGRDLAVKLRAKRNPAPAA